MVIYPLEQCIVQVTMSDISRCNSVLKCYNRSNESALPFIPSKLLLLPSKPVKRKSVCEKDDVCMRQENTVKNSVKAEPTLLRRKLSKNHIRLDRWIIKPLGDGICVEGHRRLTLSSFQYLQLFCVHINITKLFQLYVAVNNNKTICMAPNKRRQNV